jgi:hypothetical protein
VDETSNPDTEEPGFFEKNYLMFIYVGVPSLLFVIVLVICILCTKTRKKVAIVSEIIDVDASVSHGFTPDDYQ